MDSGWGPAGVPVLVVTVGWAVRRGQSRRDGPVRTRAGTGGSRVPEQVSRTGAEGASGDGTDGRSGPDGSSGGAWRPAGAWSSAPRPVYCRRSWGLGRLPAARTAPRGGLSSTAEHRIVAPKVTGSKPVGHPNPSRTTEHHACSRPHDRGGNLWPLRTHDRPEKGLFLLDRDAAGDEWDLRGPASWPTSSWAGDRDVRGRCERVPGRRLRDGWGRPGSDDRSSPARAGAC